MGLPTMSSTKKNTTSITRRIRMRVERERPMVACKPTEEKKDVEDRVGNMIAAWNDRSGKETKSD